MSQGLNGVIIKDLGGPMAVFHLEANTLRTLNATYFDGTPDALKGNTKWIVGSYSDLPFSTKTTIQKTGDTINISLEPKFCGPQFYAVEAYSEEPQNIFPYQLMFFGFAEKKVIKTKWSKTNGGKDIRETPIKYGDAVWLNVETEGLNGGKLDIHILNRATGLPDSVVAIFKNVNCIQGEINLKIGNTFIWKKRTTLYTSDREEFYIKIKFDKNWVKDNKGDDEHARYLRIIDEVSRREVSQSSSDKPAVISQSEVNVDRYELCRFEKIVVTDEGKDITLFEEGKLKIDSKQKSEFQFSHVIYFDTDKDIIRKDAKPILDGIAQLLLNNPYVPVELGAHCDIRHSDDYNLNLSLRRAVASVNYLVSKGVKKEVISAYGYGKKKLLIKGEDLKEEQHQLNRRVTIKFKIFGADAESIVFSTPAPDETKKKVISFEAKQYETGSCLRTGKHKHDSKIYVTELTSQGKNGPNEYKKSGHKIYSDMSGIRTFPFKYIWPKSVKTNDFHFYINSCRYYSKNDKATVVVKVYPDIKWELAFEFIINVSNYKATNMPSGSVFAKHQEKSREAGYKRWLMNKQGKVPISIGVGLSAEWNDGESKYSFTNEFAKKIEILANTIAAATDIVQKAINYAQSAAKKTALPVGFDIRYPKATVVGSWFLEPSKGDIIIAGTVGFGFKPLIGAEVIIDIIAAAITAVSYGTTGNPAAAKLINNFRGGLEKLGASVTFTATFFGELEIIVDALKIDSKNGIDMQGKTTIGGKFGVTIELSISTELGKYKSKKTKPIIKFKAGIRADGYFGGDMIIDSDDTGLYIEPILKFSGIMLVGEIEGEVGWWKKSFKLEERVMDDEKESLGKKYFV